MVVSRRFSKEERVLDKQDTLEMLKQGVSCRGLNNNRRNK